MEAIVVSGAVVVVRVSVRCTVASLFSGFSVLWIETEEILAALLILCSVVLGTDALLVWGVVVAVVPSDNMADKPLPSVRDILVVCTSTLVVGVTEFLLIVRGVVINASVVWDSLVETSLFLVGIMSLADCGSKRKLL